MFIKLAIVTHSVVMSMAAWHGPIAGGKPAALYPAGISPHACPNYPHCDNPAVAITAPVHGAYANAGNGGHSGAYASAHTGKWNGPYASTYNTQNHGQWNHQQNSGWHDPKAALNRGEYIGDGDYHGEGLAESGAFGPVNYDNNDYKGAQNYAGAYNHHTSAAQVPEGIDPLTCPNYPFCIKS